MTAVNIAHKTTGYTFGAGDEARTRDLNLGKVALYQLSYSRLNTALLHAAHCFDTPTFCCYPAALRLLLAVGERDYV